MNKSIFIIFLALCFLTLFNLQAIYSQDIAKGDEDPNANYNQLFEKDKTAKDKLVINSDEINRIVDEEINRYLKKMKQELSDEMKQQIKKEVQSAIADAMKSDDKVSITKKVKDIVSDKVASKVKSKGKCKGKVKSKAKVSKKCIAKKAFAKPIKKSKGKACISVEKVKKDKNPVAKGKAKIDMVESKDGGYIQYIKIADDNQNGVTIKNRQNVPAILIAICTKGTKGHIKLFAQNIANGKTFIVHEIDSFQFIKGYGEDQFLWNGTYLVKGKRISLPSGSYKIFCEIDLFDDNPNNGKVGFLKRYWGKNYSSYNIIIK